MRTLNNKNRLANSSGIGQDNPNKAMQTASETKKTPWHLRFAPGAILRKKAIIAIIAVVALLTPVSAMALHPVVVFLLGWTAGQTLTAAKQSTIDKWLAVKKATASVNGAYWVSNSYSYNLTAGDDYYPFGSNTTTNLQATQGHEIDDDPSGTENGVAISEERAESLLEVQGWYARIDFSGLAVNDDGEEVWVIWMSSRGDKFSEVKKKGIEGIRKLEDDDSYEWDNDWWVKSTIIRKVGNHKMVSEYNDPNVPKVPELATPGPTSTKYYWATVAWTEHAIDMYGQAGPGEPDKRRVRFRSHRTSPRRRELCHLNQIIKDQHISAGIARKIEQRTTRVWGPRGTWRGIKSGWITKHRLYVVHANEGDIYGASN